MSTSKSSSSDPFVDIMEKNHMEIPWHDYTTDDSTVLIRDAGLIEKASVIGRVGLIMLLWHRSLEGSCFHEPAVPGTGTYLHRGYWPDVYRI